MYDPQPNIRDTRMQERAIRERWPMAADVRGKVLRRLVSIVDPDFVHDGHMRPDFREVISAARAIISADKENREWARFEHQTRPPERPDDDFLIDLAPEDDPPQQGDRPAT